MQSSSDHVAGVFGVVMAALVIRNFVHVFDDRNAVRKAIPAIVVAACLWLPFSWLVLIPDAWSDYRLSWLRMWPYLPGFLPGIYFFHAQHELLEFGTMAVVTLILLLALTWLGNRGRASLIAAAVLALANSIPAAGIAYAVYRM